MKVLAAGFFLLAIGHAQTDPLIEVKPGPPVIKDQDLYEKTVWLHPFTRMPLYVIQDQKLIWTSPVHTAKSDIKWWAIFGGATAALVATDHWVVTRLPNSKSQVSVSNWGSRFGSAYSLIPISAGFYFIGTGKHDERLRETGLIAFETLVDANLVGEAIKLIANRARPLEANGRGAFENSPNGRWNSSFPSGHALNIWALASVVAHEYPKPIVYVLAYGLASTVVVARVGARKHFPSDVLAGGAMGWFMGDFVYGRRHNRALDRKPSVGRRILDHVQIGASPE
ncbi:MAG: phosphoesterase, PA-phosphatase related [Candidatus Solibacter sp.]|nr:phosphoesterase, PA-phosphatase related [Candidatus Solibacter sp.]